MQDAQLEGRPNGPNGRDGPSDPGVLLRVVLKCPIGSPENRRLAMELAWRWVRSNWPRLVPPQLLLAGESIEQTLPGLKLTASTRPDPSTWLLEVAQDERASHRRWTTRVVVAKDAEADLVAIRTTCSDLATAPAAAPPRLLGAWVERLALEDAGVAVIGEPRTVERDAELRALAGHLVHPERTLPIVVLANKPNTRYFGVDPRGLAEAARGLAHVVCLPSDARAWLTQHLGQRLAPVPGAVRIYRPGFSPDAASDRHPLIHVPARTGSPESTPAGHAARFRRSLCRQLCAFSVEARYPGNLLL